MADRKSAEIFGRIFDELSDRLRKEGGESLDGRSLALWLWRLSRRYDFMPQQLSCYEQSLVDLGLARWRDGDGSLYLEYLDEDYTLEEQRQQRQEEAATK